jgi:hypothetical protein
VRFRQNPSFSARRRHHHERMFGRDFDLIEDSYNSRSPKLPAEFTYWSAKTSRSTILLYQEVLASENPNGRLLHLKGHLASGKPEFAPVGSTWPSLPRSG